jgi:hypothetical protein
MWFLEMFLSSARAIRGMEGTLTAPIEHSAAFRKLRLLNDVFIDILYLENIRKIKLKDDPDYCNEGKRRKRIPERFELTKRLEKIRIVLLLNYGILVFTNISFYFILTKCFHYFLLFLFIGPGSGNYILE